MAHFILGPVEAAPDDLAWIEDLRRDHDPHCGLVTAHVTLVFGFASPSLAVAVAHAREVARRFAPIDYRLTSVRAVRDLAGEGSHVFLVPGPGAAELVALHDALYGGPLAEQLRADIPFIPHVTAGHFQSYEAAEALALELSGMVDVSARLGRLDIAEFYGGPVVLLETVSLAG
jgi:2'-5' RNA ligase